MPCPDTRDEIVTSDGEVLAVADVADGQALERSGDSVVGKPRAVVGAYLATTGNINLSVQPATIDGANAGTTRVVLVNAQTSPIENGVYISAGIGNAMTRDPAFPAGATVPRDVTVLVHAGATLGGTQWASMKNSPTASLTIGTDAWVWTRTGGVGIGDFMKDGSVAATGDFDMGGNSIGGLADGVADDDAATVGQVTKTGLAYALAAHMAMA